jgi:hypothetical protein
MRDSLLSVFALRELRRRKQSDEAPLLSWRGELAYECDDVTKDRCE